VIEPQSLVSLIVIGKLYVIQAKLLFIIIIVFRFLLRTETQRVWIFYRKTSGNWYQYRFEKSPEETGNWKSVRNLNQPWYFDLYKSEYVINLLVVWCTE